MAASQDHEELVLVLKNWVSNDPKFSNLYNVFDLNGEIDRPIALPCNEKGIKSIPDYYGISDDDSTCVLGEAKTEYAGQTIFDTRATKQLKAYFKWLKMFEKSALLLAMPSYHIFCSKHDVMKIKKESNYTGAIYYFDETGIIE